MLNAGLEEAQAKSATAGSLLVEALRAWRQFASNPGMALALAGLGEVAAGHGAPGRAGQLFGAGRALLPATARLLAVVVPYDLSARLATARAQGDQTAFDQGLTEGRAWTIDQAVAAGLASAEASRAWTPRYVLPGRVWCSSCRPFGGDRRPVAGRDGEVGGDRGGGRPRGGAGRGGDGAGQGHGGGDHRGHRSPCRNASVVVTFTICPSAVCRRATQALGHGKHPADGLLARLHQGAGDARSQQAAHPVLVKRRVHAADDRDAQGPADEPRGVVDRRADARRARGDRAA